MENLHIHFPFSILNFQFISRVICLNRIKNSVVVVAAANKSATGSARNTANSLSAKKCGRIKINGISRKTLRSSARKSEILASPSATNDCWNPVWNALVNPSAKYTRSAQMVRSTNSSSDTNLADHRTLPDSKFL